MLHNFQNQTLQFFIEWGILISFNFRHPLKDEFPIDVRVGGRLISSSDELSLNTESSISVIDDFNLTFLREKHPLKAKLHIFVILSGISIIYYNHWIQNLQLNWQKLV